MDRGSTHNFIQAKVVKYLHLVVEPILSFGVVVGNGQRLNCDRIMRGVPLHIQGYDLPMDLYVLFLHEANMVLGVS